MRLGHIERQVVDDEFDDAGLRRRGRDVDRLARAPHSLCVPASDLDSPPVSGATYLTSITEVHQHMVTLTQALLMAVAGGAKVMVTTSTMDGHTHDFTVQRVASTVPVPPSSPPVTGPHY